MYNRVEKNFKDFEETHVNCKIPKPLVNIYMTLSNSEATKLKMLANHCLD